MPHLLNFKCESCGNEKQFYSDGYGRRCDCFGLYRIVNPLTWWSAHTNKAPYSSNEWAASDRGWLYRDGEQTSLGHYLEYGPDHYRISAEWCAGCKSNVLPNNDPDGANFCAKCQPGNVHAVSCVTRKSRYFVTVEEAQRWIEKEAGITATVAMNPKERQ